MKKDVIIGGCGLAIAIMMIVALFGNDKVKGDVGDILHEIRTFDAWNQAAFAPSANGIGANPCPLGQGGFANPGWRPYPQDPIFPVLFSHALPIRQGSAPPQLIKELGVEVIPVSGGKVKITSVMGNSWADKAGLKRNDIILRFNRKKIGGLEHFKRLIKGVSPEKDYRIKILRSGRTKSLLVTVGEGEMEGFAPIVPAAFMYPSESVGNGLCLYVCPRCGNSRAYPANRAFPRPRCPACYLPTIRR